MDDYFCEVKLLLKFLNKHFFNYNEKELKKLNKIVQKINNIDFSNYTDEQLKQQTEIFKERLKKGEKLEKLLPEVFATIREASSRVLKMRHFDVQLLGGMVLNNGDIAEMKTGEGKTLVGTLAAYLNSLEGKGVHVITANDYLAKRDQEELEPLFTFLGVTTALNHKDLNKIGKQEVYKADITFGTNNEFAFDYLRDNMVLNVKDKVQRELNYVIIDEVDSILIDESRTPLIITSPSDVPSQIYKNSNALIPFLKEGVDFEIEEKATSVLLTDEGVVKTEKFFNIDNLYDVKNSNILHYVSQSLHAHILMKKNKDYVLTKNGIEIIDQFTGRISEGRRFSNGLHQAIEAKENVEIQQESKTLASITFQNYFRLYEKIAGMTGTAETEKEEFLKIYNTDVIVIPTNEPTIREDKPDLVFRTIKEKNQAIVDEVKKRYEKGQPVLVGTPTIEESESLSELFKKEKVSHNVLNAKNHEKEAEIIKNAGQKKSITIATNMAGRGTDIKLGEGVKELGGLMILGTSKHESRRIDNQLRGRAGRQGDPGYSQFFISLEDELIVRFGGEQIKSLMTKLGFKEGQSIESNLLTKSFMNAQKHVEGMNYDARKRLLEYDDVLREQRELIYKERDKILSNEDLKNTYYDFFEKTINFLVERFTPEYLVPEDWEIEELLKEVQKITTLGNYNEKEIRSLEEKEIKELFFKDVKMFYQSFEAKLPKEEFLFINRSILISILDKLWISHIDYLTELKQGIHLRAYGQNDPLIEYQKIAYESFENLLIEFSNRSTQSMLHTIKNNQNNI